MNTILPELLDLIRFQQEYIVAIPSDVAASLPAMPGFDGDWAVDLVERAKALAASPNTTTSGAADTCTILPDGSAFAVASFPLPKDHWLYAPREYAPDAEEPKELPRPILAHAQRAEIVAAIRYAIRGATMCGNENDFDPDALVQNAVYALCGPFGGALAASAPVAPTPKDWCINHSTGTPILTYKDCSVIESEQAELVMRLLGTEAAPVTPTQPADLTVWFGSLPESNGKKNWSAILHRKGATGFEIFDGFQFARSEHHDRVRYDADCMRHLIGELAEQPDLLAYDGDMLEPAAPEAAPVAPAPQQGEYLPLTQADVDRIVPVLEPVNGARHPVEWLLWNDRKRIRAELGAHIASRGAAQAAPAEIDAKTFQSYAETRAYSKGYYAGKKAAQAAPAPVAEDAEDGARFRAMVNATFADDEAFERAMHAASETEPETIDDFRALVDKARAHAAQPEGGA